MATKYPLYTFISLVPFSILGTLGAMKALRPGRPRYVPWIVVGPTLLLWIAYVGASFLCSLGLLWIALCFGRRIHIRAVMVLVDSPTLSFVEHCRDRNHAHFIDCSTRGFWYLLLNNVALSILSLL